MQNSKKIELMILRIIATIGVVFLHTCNTHTTNRNLFITSEQQFEFMAIGTASMMWAVPCFLMISGELLLIKDKPISFKIATNKYVKRVFLALITFGIPFSMMEIIVHERNLNLLTFIKAILNVINGKSWSHLWYLYALIGIYLLLPVIKIIIDNIEKCEFEKFIIVLFILNFVLPFIDLFAGTSINFKLPITGYTLVYLLMGKYISDYVNLRNIKVIKLFISCLFLLIIQFLLCMYGENEFLDFVGYNSPITAALSVNIYIIFKSLFYNKAYKINECIWKIDRLCFGVYLIHPFFINLTYKMFNIYPTVYEFYWIFVFVFWLFFVICSFIGTKLLSLIPFINKYIL